MRRARTAGALLAALGMMVALGSPVEAQSRHRSTRRQSTHRSYGHYSRSTNYRPYYRPHYYRPHYNYRPYYGYRPYYRPGAHVYGYFGYPYSYYPYYWPSFGFAYGYGYGAGLYPGYSYPYYASGPDRAWASVRIEVKPKQAKVYVDGYYAGVVDSYDGTFQRLNVPPGNHVITVYLEGYRTIEQTLYFSPDNSYKIKQEMVPLAPGEAQEPPPQPPEEQEGPGPGPETAAPPAPSAWTPEAPAQAPPPPPMPATPRPPAAVTAQPGPASDFGVLEVRVQPQGARLLIDGEPWPIADPSAPISVHLSQGRHNVQIDKDGYRPFSGDVVVSAGRTTTLNVKLSSARPR